MTALYTWPAIARHLTAYPFGSVMHIEKIQIAHPRSAGMKPSVGLPVGQQGDWRATFPAFGNLHVRDFGTHYSAHLDKVSPEKDPVGHIVSDTPQIAGGVALGALLGAALGRSKEGALVGALFGGLLGVASAAAQAEPKKRPT